MTKFEQLKNDIKKHSNAILFLSMSGIILAYLIMHIVTILNGTK